ncbi:MAG: hypothetical protein KAI17_24450, partial [Thiotrichaceae bacterium]|nr:hypothetical protein [Thiotrichaceae bacterium]
MFIKNIDFLEGMGFLGDDSIDAIVTDPPYGILKHKIETGVDIDAFFKEAHRVLKPNGFIAFFGQQPTLTIWNAKAFQYFNYKNEVIWYKRQTSSPFQDMQRVYENCTICVKGKRKFNKTRLPYLEHAENMGEYTSWAQLKSNFSAITGILKSKDKMKAWMRRLDGERDYLGDTNPVNSKSSVSSSFKSEKRFIGNAMII